MHSFAHIPYFSDHLIFVSDFRQLPCQYFPEFFPFFLHCCFCICYFDCSRRGPPLPTSKRTRGDHLFHPMRASSTHLNGTIRFSQTPCQCPRSQTTTLERNWDVRRMRWSGLRRLVSAILQLSFCQASSAAWAPFWAYIFAVACSSLSRALRLVEVAVSMAAARRVSRGSGRRPAQTHLGSLLGCGACLQ